VTLYDYRVGGGRVLVLCGVCTRIHGAKLRPPISVLWGNTAYCVKWGGEDLPRYSNKIEPVGLRTCSYYHYRSPSKKVMPQ